MIGFRLALVLMCLLALLASARAEQPFDPFASAGIDGRTGVLVPQDVAFVDDTGAPVTLGDYAEGKPIILAPVYYTCPNLCGVTLTGLFTGLNGVAMTPGVDFEVVAISIDPHETAAEAAEAKTKALERYRRPTAESSVHFLTGSADSVAAVTKAIGFRYDWDPRLQQYAHIAGVAVLTPEGRLARWLYGVQYEPTDLRLALTEAGEGRIGSVADKLLLLCYHYDPVIGRYGSIIQSGLRTASIATVFALGVFILVAVRRERRSGERREV